MSGTGQIGDVEWLAVSRVGEVSRAEQVPGREDGNAQCSTS